MLFSVQWIKETNFLFSIVKMPRLQDDVNDFAASIVMYYTTYFLP